MSTQEILDALSIALPALEKVLKSREYPKGLVNFDAEKFHDETGESLDKDRICGVLNRYASLRFHVESLLPKLVYMKRCAAAVEWVENMLTLKDGKKIEIHAFQKFREDKITFFAGLGTFEGPTWLSAVEAAMKETP